MRLAVVLTLAGSACAPAAAPDPPPALPPAASSAPSFGPADDGCKHDDDCPVVMAMHQPCCLESSGRGRCSGLPPKADACPGRHRCLSDADCHRDAKCAGDAPARTCDVPRDRGGRGIPGECINAAPNTKLPDSCSHLP